MFCQKCGKEIMDEAVVCIHCGCSTGKAHAVNNEHTSDWIVIREFAQKAKNIKVWGIISMCLIFGVGVIPGFITALIAKSTDVPNVTTNNPIEIAEYELAKKNLGSGQTLAAMAAVINVMIWVIMFFMAPILFDDYI